MIDVKNVTNFARTDAELEEFALFCPLVIGTNADTAARTLAELDGRWTCAVITPSGFSVAEFGVPLMGRVRWDCRTHGLPFTCGVAASWLRQSGARWYRMKGAAVAALAAATDPKDGSYDLRACTRKQLDDLPGWGLKTASLFLLHSRPGWEGACLDRHVLRRLQRIYRAQAVPDNSPGSAREYARVEKLFLRVCARLGRPPYEVDFAWWEEERAEAVRRGAETRHRNRKRAGAA